MKNKYLLVGSLAFSLVMARAQNKDSSIVKINETEVEYLFNHYTQDGDNSAVTGGEGTEKLTVYGPSLSVKRSFGKNTLRIKAGTDIISSASTDNIDFVVSSASALDARTHGNIEYGRFFPKSRLAVSAGYGASIESDYYSRGFFFGISKESKDDMLAFSAGLQIFNDDLRWGRLNPTHRKPVKLIYPVELRNREWFDVNHRKSYNLNIQFSQVVDKRNIVALSSVLSYQKGLLSTPFHRVYFSNDSLVVERLPRQRNKVALGLKWNKFVGGNVILRNSINGYSDDFGIIGISVQNETAIKINRKWTITPRARLYAQRKSRYFKAIREHSSDEEFYTSDYDLSDFRSFKIGIGAKYSPANRKALNSMSLKYLFYSRSNKLKGHIVSLLMNYKYYPKSKKS